MGFQPLLKSYDWNYCFSGIHTISKAAAIASPPHTPSLSCSTNSWPKLFKTLQSYNTNTPIL